MPVRLVFLGRLQELAGSGERTVTFDNEATVGTLIAALEPALASELHSPRVRIAVNGVVIAPETAITDGDEVAFLPPVSGG